MRIKLGISSCLLGEAVRWDGGHKLDRFLADTMGQFVEYVPVCPEVECGLSIPREAMRLVGEPDSPRLVTSSTGKDHTARMLRWAHKRVRELDKEDLCGFIFKSRSPSSGMERVKVYSGKGVPKKKGVGMFARVFMEHYPLLPVEEDGRLHDTRLRENFIERIFTFKRWREMLEKRKNLGNLVDFHTRHKLLVLSHSPQYHRMMGKLVTRGKEIPLEKLFDEYQFLLMKALKLKTTPKKNVNTLMHVMRCFKKALASDEKQELLETLERCRHGQVPLIVPVTLINHYVRKCRQPYLMDQYYLHPHPLELQLRNHA